MKAGAEELWLGIDVGGTSCRAALVGAGAEIAGTLQRRPTPGGATELGGVLRELRDACLAERRAGYRAVGVGLPGWWDRATGVMRRAVNLPFLEGMDVRAMLNAALETTAFVESDVNAAGWAQQTVALRGADPPAARGAGGEAFAYISIGTGIGACVIVEGALLTHTRGGPGHFGHLVVDTADDAPRCACGQRGCAEAVLAAWRALPQRAGGRESPSQAPSLVRALAVVCLHVAGVYAPRRIALGGGLVDADAGLVPAIAGACGRMRGTLWPDGLTIARGVLASDRAGVIGAALLAGRA